METSLKVVYDDESIMVFDKQQGIAVTPGKTVSLCDIVFKKYPCLKSVIGYKKNEGGLLNRLDNKTGGLVMFARSNESFDYYSSLMKKNEIAKYYLAMVDGVPASKNGIINTPIAHSYSDKRKMTVARDNINFRGKPREALTYWRLLKTNGNRSYLEVIIYKGARHQIRIHLSDIGMPVVGDRLYNKITKTAFNFHLLYANKIKFVSISNKNIILKTDVPFWYNLKNIHYF